MLRINDDDLTMTDDYCYLYQGGAFTGIAVRTFEGQVLSEYTYHNGARAGRCRTWDYEEGYLERDAFMRGNALHGMAQEWYEFGQRKSLKQYEHGICTRGLTWDQFGNVVEVYRLTEADPLHRTLELSRGLYASEVVFRTDEDAALTARLEAELDDLMQSLS